MGVEPTVTGLSDAEAMRLALDEADRAADHDDVPVGAIALLAGTPIASHHNERELRGDPTAHAELLALRSAAVAVAGWRLSDITLVVTLEPCPMCAGALVAARVGRLVFGAADPRAGACGSLYNLCADPRLNQLREARLKGYEGDACGECGNFTLVRNGTCLKCETCGSTSGCS